MALRKTRYKELAYDRLDTGSEELWRIFDVSSGSAIGPHYRTEKELLGDLDRYARQFGCDDALPESRTEPNDLIEVTRSFSFKLNIGNYQSVDFFCSQKAQCHKDEATQKSQALHGFCYATVLADVRTFCHKLNIDSPL